MAGTLVSYLPFTRSVTEDLSGKEWTVTGNPQIITHVDSPSFAAAKFETGESITSPSLLFKKAMAFCLDFFIYIPNTGTEHLLLDMPTSNGFISSIYVLESGKLELRYNHKYDFSGTAGWYMDTSNTYTNRWINLRLCYNTSSFSSPSIYLYINQYRDDDDYIREEEEIYINLSSYRNDIQASIYLGNGCLFNKFRLYTGLYDYGDLLLPTSQSSTMTFDKSIEQEFLVTNTVYFESLASVNLKTYNKSQQWYYKNIGTADGLLVSGTSLTNVSPLKSVTSKAFYQTNRAKCFDTQASKEIYMLFDVYFDGTKRWRAYEESSTNGVTGITAQTSGVLNIFSNNTNIGASIPLTINKLETYLLYMKSDATNGYIEVWKDGEWKYTYIGNVNNGDDFSNLELQSDGAGTVFSNIVISNQSIYDYDRWTGNYTTIQRTLTNETWVKERCLKALLPPFQKMDLCGHEWTAVGNPKIQDGKLYLDGSSYLQMAEKFAFTGQPFTISLKFSTTNVPGSTSLCLWLMYVSTYDRIQLSTNSSKQLALWKDSDSTLWLRTSFSVIDGQEHHAECSFDGSTWYLFLDGVLIGSKVLTCPDKQYTLYIGYNPANGSHFKGSISNFQIYDGVALHTENFTPPTTEDYTTYKQQLTSDNTLKNHLMSWLSFDPSTDLCGNTWTITGTAPTITNINALNGKATQFGKGYIYTNPPELKNNHFTIDFWEYIPSTINGLTGKLVVIDGTDGTNTQCLNIGYDAGATVPSLWLGKGTKSGWVYQNKIIGTKIRDQWVHRAVVRYNDKIYAFENGNLYTSFDIELGFYIEVTDSSLFVGGFKRASRLFPGMLSEVRVYVGTALWTTNFTPPTQEDYFETYWYFNKPAPILNTNYNILRYLTNNANLWKYLNPGYNDINHFTYNNTTVTQVQARNAYTDMQISGDITINTDIYQELWVKFDMYLRNAYGSSPIFSFPYGKGAINIFIQKPSLSTDEYTASISHPRNEENQRGNQVRQEFDYANYILGYSEEVVSFIVHIKSDAYNKGAIEVTSSYWTEDGNDRIKIEPLSSNFELVNANINEGNNLSHILTVRCVYNLIVSNQQLTFDDMIAHNINPVQRSIINNEEWRIARYCLKSWMLFDESPTKDLCGNTWTAYNNPSIIDTDVLHGKALQLNSGQYLSMPNTISLGGDKDYTICGWYKMSSSSGTWAPIFVFYQKANDGPLIKISRNATTSRYAFGYPDGTFNLGSSIDSNLCYFTIIYIAHSARFIIYLDGKMIVNAGIDNTNRYDYKLYIGKSNYNDGPYIGTVNEFKVYDGYALYSNVTEFTPPVHKMTDDKLYYDKSAETMKFDYFADVQKTTWSINIAELTSKKILVSYLPFDGNVKDLCDDKRDIYISGSTPVFSSQDSTKNKSLSLSSYDGSSYATRSYNGYFNLLPYDKSWKFIAELDIIANLPGDSFTAQSNHINILRIGSDSTTIVNILYWDPENPLDVQGATSNVAKLFIGNERYFSNPPDTFIDDYTLTAQSKKSFHVTIIFDNDELNPSTIIVLKPLDGGNSYIYRLIGDNIPLYNKGYSIDFGGTNNATNGLNINIDEFKFYLDYNDSTPDTIIDKNIEIRFNNGEEAVYFEFYANIDLSKPMMINISPSILCWYYLQENNKLRIQGSQAFIPLNQFDPPKGIKACQDYPSLEHYQFLENYRTNSNVVYAVGAVYFPPQIDYLPYTLFFWIRSQSCYLGPDNIWWYIEQDSTGLKVSNEDNDTLFAVTKHTYSSVLDIHHLALVLENSEASLYVNGSYVDTINNPTSHDNWKICEGATSSISLYGFGAVKGNIFKNGKVNLGYIGCPPSYAIGINNSQVSKPRLALQHNDNIYYNKLVLPTDENASKIRIYHNNTIYALSK